MNSQGDSSQHLGEQTQQEQSQQLEAENKILQEEIARLRSAHQQAMEKLQTRLSVEKAYQESQQRFHTIFEQSKLGNKIIASDLRILQVNQALATMLGYDKAELEGNRIINYAHADYLEHWWELQKKLWTEQIPSFQIETVLVKKDGSFLWCRVTSILFTDEADTLGYTTVEDISIHKEWETLRKQQRRSHEHKVLLEAVLEGQGEERRRIAESLHNGVGQILYATKLNLERVALSILAEQTPEAHQVMEKTQQLLNKAISETRRVSHELAPVLLKDYGLGRAIEEFCGYFAGTSIELHCYCMSERLPAPVEITLYRISQELVNNIFRHSGATKARLELYIHENYLYLEVQDDGKGMASHIGKNENYQDPSKGLGLRTIYDRVKLMEGTLEIESTLDKGTLISIRLPLPT